MTEVGRGQERENQRDGSVTTQPDVDGFVGGGGATSQGVWTPADAGERSGNRLLPGTSRRNQLC